jgi:EAL domain-containing protein (putative c-di-GMP-specific phosphodiesterase class I)
VLKPDIVKLEMSLTRDVDSSPVKRKIISAMVSLCREKSTL